MLIRSIKPRPDELVEIDETTTRSTIPNDANTYFAITLRRGIRCEQETKLNQRPSRYQIFFLNDNDETCTFQKDVRGNRTGENAYQMPDEDRSSHRFFAFAQIAEKKRVLFPLFRQVVYCRFFFLFAKKKPQPFKP